MGIDIEAVRDLQLSYFKKYFTQGEWNKIISKANPVNQTFYFGQKKSVIKAEGKD